MTTSKRLTGLLMVIVAAGSLMITLAALVQVWRLRQPVTQYLRSNLRVVHESLGTTSDGLLLTSQSLDSVQASVTALSVTVDTLGKSIQDSEPMMDSLVVLMGEDLPETISSAQTSLSSAQESAKIIDAVLRALTIFNPRIYNPRVPLNDALGQVSESLDDLPKSFSNMEVGLKSTQRNLTTIQVQIDLMSGEIERINESLDGSRKVINQYQGLFTRAEKRVINIKNRAPATVTTLAWVLSFLLFWLGVAQVGLLIRGLEWLRVKKQPD